MLVLAIVSKLAALYPDAKCSLVYTHDYELLFATRLSAQCTDARVNLVTPALFRAYPLLTDYAHAPLQDLEDAVHSCGFYKHKARDIKLCAAQLIERFDGRVPQTMDELLSLAGVGRKTANLLLGDLFGQPSIVVDTHCIRLSNRLGLVSAKDPEKIEHQLQAMIPPEEQTLFCHRLILHGRGVCVAQRPRCGDCELAPLCPRII